MGKHNIYDVAKWFLDRESMSHKKLQKLCYYAQAWHYVLYDGEPLTDATFEAWVHGPVNPQLWETYKYTGWDPIKDSDSIAGLTTNSKFDNEELELLESVWETYGDHTGNALEALSHSELPWIEARGACAADDICTTEISPSTMQKYYSSIYSGNES